MCDFWTYSLNLGVLIRKGDYLSILIVKIGRNISLDWQNNYSHCVDGICSVHYKTLWQMVFVSLICQLLQ